MRLNADKCGYFFKYFFVRNLVAKGVRPERTFNGELSMDPAQVERMQFSVVPDGTGPVFWGRSPSAKALGYFQEPVYRGRSFMTTGNQRIKPFQQNPT
jgi:hypothetical protein